MNGTLVAAQVENVSTRRDKTLKVVFGLQEVTPSRGAELLSMQDRVVALYISPKETISQSELDQVDAVDIELPGKTQSQRLRNTLYVLYSKVPEGFKTFDDFYRAKTDAMIEQFKSKIPA